MIRGYAERQRAKYEEVVYGAWMAAALQRQKKLPKLERLLGKEKRPRKDARSAEERRKEWEEIKRKFGVG